MPDVIAENDKLKTAEEKLSLTDRKVRWTPGTQTVLKIILVANGGAKFTINWKYPKNNLTKLAVTNLFNEMITDGMWVYNENEATDISDMYLYQTTYTEIGS